MRGFVIAASLVLMLSVAPAFAQTPAPARPAPPPARTAPAPVPESLPFPQGAKIAFVNLQQIAALTSEGKASAARVEALIQKKQNEGNDKSKALAANQQKLQQSGALLSDAARAQLEKDIEKQQVDGQRFQQDAQAEINELQQELQGEFQKKLLPVIQQLAQEKGLQILFSAADAGVIWAEPGLDLTMEAVKKMDAGSTKAPATPKP
jgi:outer membrane protein